MVDPWSSFRAHLHKFIVIFLCFDFLYVLSLLTIKFKKIQTLPGYIVRDYFYTVPLKITKRFTDGDWFIYNMALRQRTALFLRRTRLCAETAGYRRMTTKRRHREVNVSPASIHSHTHKAKQTPRWELNKLIRPSILQISSPKVVNKSK